MKLSRLLFSALAPALILSAAPAEAAGQKAYVQIKSARLMDQPKLWGKPVGTLSYGDELSLSGEAAAGWFQVQTRSGKSGYLHQSALTTSRIVLHSGGSAGSGAADQSDVVLAGKGFNSSVERQYAAGNSSADFRAVDQVEQSRVSPTELAQFIKQGRLKQ